MKAAILDVIVIGGGQSGLNASYFLKQHGLKHIVFERGKIGESWRSQRWDSFRLNTPGHLNGLAGEATTTDTFCKAIEFAEALDEYATRHQLPVLEKVNVISVEKNEVSGIFNVTVSHKNEVDHYYSRQVIIASGSQNQKKLPEFSRRISSEIGQLHASEYRNSDQLKEGAVLVVGSGQSGCQIVDDLLEAGRKVYFSTSMVSRVPRRYRGRDIMDWLMELKFFEARTKDTTDPVQINMKPPQLTGIGGDRTISLQMLAKKGAVVLGKANDAGNHMILLQPDAAKHVQFADQISQMVKGRIDELIINKKLDVPIPLHDEADMPDPDASCVTDISILDLTEHNIHTIIWATGFNCTYDYIRLPVLNEAGMPIHENGVSEIEGLYFLGLSWLRTRGSSLIHGSKNDAEFIVAAIASAIR